MASLLRGEIRWADLETAARVVGHEQGNPRPVLTLSNNQFNINSQQKLRQRPRLLPRQAPQDQSHRVPSPFWVTHQRVDLPRVAPRGSQPTKPAP